MSFINFFPIYFFYKTFVWHRQRAESESVPVNVRPESSSSAEQLDSPDREVLQMGSSLECASPAPTAAAYGGAYGAWDSNPDPTQGWDDEPTMNELPPDQAAEEQKESSYQEYNAESNGYVESVCASPIDHQSILLWNLQIFFSWQAMLCTV